MACAPMLTCVVQMYKHAQTAAHCIDYAGFIMTELIHLHNTQIFLKQLKMLQSVILCTQPQCHYSFSLYDLRLQYHVMGAACIE